MPTQPTTSQANPFLSEIQNGSVIPDGKLAYFRARLINRLHELILSTFQKVEQRDQLTRAQLAKRVGRKPEQITRWFAHAGNLEIGTVSDLLLGMGFEPDFSLVDLKHAISRQPQVEELPSVSIAASVDTTADGMQPDPVAGLARVPMPKVSQSAGLARAPMAKVLQSAL